MGHLVLNCLFTVRAYVVDSSALSFDVLVMHVFALNLLQDADAVND